MSLTVDSRGRLVDTIDPNADLDYVIDLAAWLAQEGDTLVSVVVTGTNCEVHDTGINGTKMVAWVRNAVKDTTAEVSFHFTTDNVPPRKDDRTIYLTVKEK